MPILEVFYQPGTLFSNLEKRRWPWVAPLLLGLLLNLVTTVSAVRTIGMVNIVRQQVENLRLNPDDMQKAIDQANTPARAYATYASVVVGGVVAMLLIAGLLTLLANIGSKQAKFSTNFSLVTLAFFPYTLIVCIMTLLVLKASPDPTALDINNMLATNVGAFMDKGSVSKGVYSLMTSLDILTIAEVVFLSYGFSKVNRTSIGFALFAIGSLWVLWVVVKLGLAMIF